MRKISQVRAQLRAAWVSMMLAACGGHGPSSPEATALERSIDQELGKRFGVQVVTRCPPLVPTCSANLSDGTTLPIFVNGGEWRVIGMVVVSDVLEDYVRAELADLGAMQGVRCAPRVRRVEPDERIECGLAQGGKAFITVHVDGSTAVELALDAAAARARSEPESSDLAKASHALENAASGDDEDDDDEHPR